MKIAAGWRVRELFALICWFGEGGTTNINTVHLNNKITPMEVEL